MFELQGRQINLCVDQGAGCGMLGVLIDSFDTYVIGSLLTDSLQVTGTKSRIAETKNYNKRLLYCYETPSPMFGDMGHGKLDENGEGYIYLDDIFVEAINTDCEYFISLQKYNNIDLWVDSKNKFYFTVKGTPNSEFDWEIKAKQRGFEFERLDMKQEKKEVETNLLQDNIDYLTKFQEELLNYEH